MVPYVTSNDISLVQKLSQNHYPSKGLTATTPKTEIDSLLELRRRLKSIADFYKDKYFSEFGPFQSESSGGNPVGRNGNLRRVWGGIFKGSDNKQYSAQLSFVVDGSTNSLDVGFFFGRASAIDLDKNTRIDYENNLKAIGRTFHKTLSSNANLLKRFNDLFELGFRAEIKDQAVNSSTWLLNTLEDPKFSSVSIRVYPNSFGYVEPTVLDFYISLLIPLVAVIPNPLDSTAETETNLNALSPEQRAEQARRLALIGLKGEEYILECERQKLIELNVNRKPKHLSLETDNAGYDIMEFIKTIKAHRKATESN